MRNYPGESAIGSVMARINTAKCQKLNVREAPELDAKVLRILGPEDEVVVDMSFKNTTFYKITSGNVTGYVVKLYLKVQK